MAVSINFIDLKSKLIGDIELASDLKTLEEIRVTALGKKGQVTELMTKIKDLSPDERKAFGANVNELKNAVDAALTARIEKLSGTAMDAKLLSEKVDVTLPVPSDVSGGVHPITQTVDEILAIFTDMGFSLSEGPDVEDDFHNFEALNFPKDHPAREMQDTFHLPKLSDGTPLILRTHTSPVQIRAMTAQKPPLRLIIPGRVYRCDSDMTHTPMFHQVEGLVIEKNTNMGHLKGCLLEFLKAFFQVDDLPIRFRPSFFPFTEPSAEVDIGCSRKGGEIKIGNHGDWLEIGGCGMVHPNVLKNCGLDPDEYQGFAFGMGIDRMAMLKYGIPDLRTFFEADMRWLKHYGFGALNIPNLVDGV